jgi:hypothetical protein
MRACSLRISPKRRHRRVEGLHLVIGPAGIDFVAILWRSRPRSRLVGLFVWHFFHSPQSLLRITAQWEGLPGTAVAGLDNDGTLTAIDVPQRLHHSGISRGKIVGDYRVPDDSSAQAARYTYPFGPPVILAKAIRSLLSRISVVILGMLARPRPRGSPVSGSGRTFA